MAELQPFRHGYYLWQYVPSLPAAVIFLLIFLVLTVLVGIKVFRTKTWFCIAFWLGGLFEFIGYAARAAAHDKTGKLMPYVIQTNFILLGPLLFAATIYMAFGRLIQRCDAQQHSPLNARWMTVVFVSSDIFSLCIQGSAAGPSVVGYPVVAKWLVIVGLLVQLIGFGIFMAVSIMWYKRMRHAPTHTSFGVTWQMIMNLLLVCSILIFARSIFRLVEYAVGTDGYILMNEWTLYVFDSILMAATMAIWWWWFPSDLVKRIDEIEFSQIR